MRIMFCIAFLCGCGSSTNTASPLQTKEKTTALVSNTFSARAKAYVAQARHDVGVLKTERDPDKLRALKTELTKAHSELKQPTPVSEKQTDLQRYLENIAINFGTAVDFQIEHLSAEQSADEEKKKTTKEDAEMLINGTPTICDQADDILKTM